MKKFAKIMSGVVLFAATAAFASAPPAKPAHKSFGSVAKAVVTAPWKGMKAAGKFVARPFHKKAAPAKKADGSGPIMTCRPGTNCDPIV